MSRRRVRASLLALAMAAGVAPAAMAGPRDKPPPIGPCDWSSFRNGPRNPGATSCDTIDVTNVAAMVPQLLYRTRDSVTSTPAVVDGVLYVGTWDGSFYAFDTTTTGVGDPSLGETPVPTVAPLWETHIDDTNSVSFGRIVSSPTVADVAGRRVVVFAGGATVYVLDAEDGGVLAQQCLDPRQGGGCQGSGDDEIEVESSPVVLPRSDGSADIISGLDVHNASGVGRTGVVRLRLARSDTSWSITPVWKYDPEAGAPIRGSGLLTSGSGSGDGCGGVWGTPAVDIVADLVVFGTASCSHTEGPDGALGTADDIRGEEVFGIRLSNGRTRWRYSPARPYGDRMDDDFGSSPQLFDMNETLVAGIGGKDGSYYALDARTGKEVWVSHFGQSGHLNEGFAIGGVLGSPALGAVAGKPAIFVTTAISTPFGAPIDRGSPDAVDLTLAGDPGRMLSLHALDAANGAVLWRQPLTRQTYGHPTFANGIVFVPSTAGLSVQAFAADAMGAPLWSSPPLNGAPSSGVAVTAGAIYIGTGTRQTDLGFKLTGEDSVFPDEAAAAIPGVVTDLVGADPQERASGIWAFRLAAAP
jgi:outer membrane protein assembly factor BamB